VLVDRNIMPQASIPRPRVACEISADRIVAVRAAEAGTKIEAAAAAALPEGLLTPGLQQANVAERAKIVPALRDSLTAVAGRVRDICLIIPDATTRVMLLDFETLPEKQQDADAVVRFRLKKSLPFDVEAAAVSFDRQGTAIPIRVMAAVTPRSVLEEYESLVREAGYNPGCVLPSMLATLGLADASRPTMVIKVERGTTTFAIVDQDQLLLYRALDNGGSSVTGESLVDDVNTSLVYFEDRYGVGVDRVFVTGVQSPQALQEALAGAGIRVEELVSITAAGAVTGNVPRSGLAGVVGALVS
jgi:type IV pilus assembly protein PilM